MAEVPNEQPLILHLMISGRVQGVSYRVWLKAEADARGITGWTRNHGNGDVEAVFAGPPETVKSLCDVCRLGPPMARVDQIKIDDAKLDALQAGIAGAFVVLPSV